MAIEVDPIVLPPIQHDDYRDFENSAHCKAFDALCQEADELPDNEVVGQVIRWHVADGYAYYKVIADDPLTVAHIPVLDAWRVDPVMIKGLDASDVREKVRGYRALRRMFSTGRKAEDGR